MKDLISQLTQSPIEQKILSNFFNIAPAEREKFLETVLSGVEVQKRHLKKAKGTSPIAYIPEYNGAAVYALIDDNGKRYIGSTLHLRNRVKQHKAVMQTVRKDSPNGLVNPKIANAILDGRTFHCEILAMINTEVSKHELEEMERIFLNRFGGIDKTYNCRPLEHKI